jgi:hypothetical protein
VWQTSSGDFTRDDRFFSQIFPGVQITVSDGCSFRIFGSVTESDIYLRMRMASKKSTLADITNSSLFTFGQHMRRPLQRWAYSFNDELLGVFGCSVKEPAHDSDGINAVCDRRSVHAIKIAHG